MRIKLKRLSGQRLGFTATVERFGNKTNYHGYPQPTILFRDVLFTDNQELASDHIWFTVGKTIEKLNLVPGNTVEFEARIGSYTKGYVNHREGIDSRQQDYKLNRPTKFKVIS